LSAYSSQQIKIRFKLRTDGAIARDGWYVDDISVFYYGIVPVELVSFNALLKDDKVELNWTTASELNNQGFEIERSKVKSQRSNEQSWNKMVFIEGKGTTTETVQYRYIDKPES